MKKSQLKELIKEVIRETRLHTFFVAYDHPAHGWHTVVRTSSAEEAKKIANKKYSYRVCRGNPYRFSVGEETTKIILEFPIVCFQ
jgi:hypothetical protein